MRSLMCWGIKTWYGDDLFPRFFAQARTKSVLEYCEIVDQRNKVAQAWYKEVKGFLRVIRFKSDMFRRFGVNTTSTEL